MSKIMIIDDDLTVTQLLTALLTMEGHESITVNDSTQALGLASTFNPDLIVLDLMMPGLNGFDLCRLLHQDPRFENIPVLVVSALEDPNSKRRAAEAGARDYLTKPFNIDDFLQKIIELIGS